MYGLGSFWGAGILALLFFNMTMPLTLFLMWNEMREQPGLAFGVLTFALFLGFLPVYFQNVLPMDYRLTRELGKFTFPCDAYGGDKAERSGGWFCI